MKEGFITVGRGMGKSTGNFISLRTGRQIGMLNNPNLENFGDEVTECEEE